MVVCCFEFGLVIVISFEFVCVLGELRIVSKIVIGIVGVLDRDPVFEILGVISISCVDEFSLADTGIGIVLEGIFGTIEDDINSLAENRLCPSRSSNSSRNSSLLRKLRKKVSDEQRCVSFGSNSCVIMFR